MAPKRSGSRTFWLLLGNPILCASGHVWPKSAL
jgi:hypothetical protein